MKCTKCDKEIEEHSFATFRDRKGIVRRRGICKACRGLRAKENFDYLQKWRHEYNKGNRSKQAARSARVRAETKAYVDEIKSRTPCADCQRLFHPVSMDFDHANGDKTGNVARMVSSAYKLDLIKDKIAKCELVCANCHRVRTQKRGEGRAPRKNKCMFTMAPQGTP